MNSQKHVVVIAGPTAVGKTALSIQLAKYFNTEIISADSRQFYKEMSIGTAKPSVSEMQNVRHHFVDFLSIQQTYTAGDFEKEAMKKIEELFAKHNVVIMCGGSGLFIDAVCKGFDEGLQSNAEIKTQILDAYNQNGLTWLQQQVKELDAMYYESADIHNPSRLMRALEVCKLTGKPYSSFRKNEGTPRNFNIIKILINEDRENLYHKINMRVDEMMDKGLLKEAKTLYECRNLNALNTVGYKELFDYIEQKTTLQKAIELIKQHTRNYAKRQLTWFAKYDDYTSFQPNEIEKIKSFIDIILQHA